MDSGRGCGETFKRSRLAREMGADLIKDLTHEVIKWDYPSAQRMSGRWEVTATATIWFPDYAGIETGLPLVLAKKFLSGERIICRPTLVLTYSKLEV